MAVIYVDLNASNSSDGSSWANAYTDLQDALVAARALVDGGDTDVQIWVADGIYSPGNDRSSTFEIDRAISIYGGFLGDEEGGRETSLDQRDFEANETILSGDIGVAADNSDNIYHVVTNSATGSRLDGVIIEDGNTTGDADTDGGGVSNTGSLVIENTIVRDNVASDDGGGISNSGTLTIYNSTLSGNTANASSSDLSGGGGLINTTSGNLTIISSTLSGNTSQKNGGAIRNDGTLKLVSSTLSGNTATESGGGLVNTTTITNDLSVYLGGSPTYDPAEATIVSSTITNNTASNTNSNGGGGGIANFGEVSVGNSIVSGNTTGNTDDEDVQISFTIDTGINDINSQPIIFTPTGTFTSEGNNLVGSGDDLSDFNGTDDQTNVSDPGLAALADNGGFTETHALEMGSPALNAGNNALTVNLSESALGVDLNNDGDTTDTIDTVGDLVSDAGVTVSIGGFEVQECFLAGTLILTEDGEKSVEDLAIGDRLLTLSGQLEPIKWIGQQTYHRATAHPLRSNPIHIKPGALGDNLPQRDLFVSPDHALLVDGLLINAGALTNDTSIVQTQPDEDSFTYYHIELQHHALLIAEGTAAESYLPQKQDRSTFDNSDEYAKLYSEQPLISLLPMNYPRVSSKRQLPRFVSKRLETLGRSLYPVAPIDQSA